MDLQRNKLLRPDQVADVLNVSRRTVYRLIEDEEFSCLRIRGAVRVFENSLARYIRKQQEKYFLIN